MSPALDSSSRQLERLREQVNILYVDKVTLERESIVKDRRIDELEGELVTTTSAKLTGYIETLQRELDSLTKD
jgi:hypothetical protein